MALSLPTRLKETAELTTSSAAAITNASGDTTIVTRIHLHNHTGASKVVTLHNVPDSAASVGTAADANEMLEITLAAGDSLDWECYIVLSDTNDTIQAKADTANSVTMAAYGIVDDGA